MMLRRYHEPVTEEEAVETVEPVTEEEAAKEVIESEGKKAKKKAGK